MGGTCVCPTHPPCACIVPTASALHVSGAMGLSCCRFAALGKRFEAQRAALTPWPPGVRGAEGECSRALAHLTEPRRSPPPKLPGVILEPGSSVSHKARKAHAGGRAQATVVACVGSLLLCCCCCLCRCCCCCRLSVRPPPPSLASRPLPPRTNKQARCCKGCWGLRPPSPASPQAPLPRQQQRLLQEG